MDLDVMFFQASMRFQGRIPARVNAALAKVREEAEHARRSIGQRIRFAREQVKLCRR